MILCYSLDWTSACYTCDTLWLSPPPPTFFVVFLCYSTKKLAVCASFTLASLRQHNLSIKFYIKRSRDFYGQIKFTGWTCLERDAPTRRPKTPSGSGSNYFQLRRADFPTWFKPAAFLVTNLFSVAIILWIYHSDFTGILLKEQDARHWFLLASCHIPTFFFYPPELLNSETVELVQQVDSFRHSPRIEPII